MSFSFGSNFYYVPSTFVMGFLHLMSLERICQEEKND